MSTTTEWRTRTYEYRSGIVEKTKFPVSVSFSGRKPTKRERSKAARKAGRAADNAERQLARLLNNNFSTYTAVHLALTYSPAALDKAAERAAKLRVKLPKLSERDALYKAAQQELENYIRRVQYAAPGIKYTAITSDMDGKASNPARIHHHVIIERESLELCKKKWAKMGYVEERELINMEGDLSPIASYFIKQVRHIPDNKRYTHSRNLTLPEYTERVCPDKYSDSEMSLPSGAKLLFRNEYIPGRSQYIRYKKPVISPPKKPYQSKLYRSEPPGVSIPV